MDYHIARYGLSGYKYNVLLRLVWLIEWLFQMWFVFVGCQGVGCCWRHMLWVGSPWAQVQWMRYEWTLMDRMWICHECLCNLSMEHLDLCRNFYYHASMWLRSAWLRPTWHEMGTWRRIDWLFDFRIDQMMCEVIKLWIARKWQDYCLMMGSNDERFETKWSNNETEIDDIIKQTMLNRMSV